MANALQKTLNKARQRERLTQAQWRRQRAEVARLVAAGEEAAAQALLEQAGIDPARVAASKQTPRTASPEEGKLWEGSPEPDDAPSAVAAKGPLSVSGDTSYKKAARAKKRAAPNAKPKRTAPSPSKAKRPQPTPVIKPFKAKPVTKRFEQKTWAVWLSERPPWVTSLATHGVLIGLFGLLTFGAAGGPGFSLTAAIGEEEYANELSAEVTLTDFELDADLTDVADSPAELSADVPLESVLEPVSFEPVTDFGAFSALSSESLMAAVPAAGSKSDGESDSQAGGGKPMSGGSPGRVSFFGSESQAERVLFVVDNSGSMQRGRMETTLLELERAVNNLSTSQQFYVVFFSDQAYPMFFPEPAEAAVQATLSNKRRLSSWLRTVENCLGGRLLDAMELAAGLEPDVVYLLTDGDIRSERIIGALTAKDRWPFAIHTLGMGARTPQHVALLHTIASNTGGAFRPVAAHPAAVARSRIQPIPYHREQGKVWGSAVQSWD